ncbi:prephenate dehydratase [Candidatus Micrarchaeota archaeon]|nr:prephenate dehydratase [Candidatus Micrarchaeota archaeon]
MSLEEKRKKIDEVDGKIVELLAERFKIVSSVGEEKIKSARPVEDTGRERDVLEKVTKAAEEQGMNSMVARRIFEEVLGASKREQIMDHEPSKRRSISPKTIAFQGERGAYSEEAIKQAYGEKEVLPCRSLHDVFEAVEKGEADAGLIPIENSTEGSINLTYDLLLNSHLTIAGETFLRVRHCLLANKGVPFGDVKRVYSHPQALAQCRFFLNENKKEPVEFYDTAGAAEHIANEKIMDAGAIASRTAAEHYGLEVLKEGIEDNRSNYTRFILVAKTAPSKGDKTSIVFSTAHKPGALFEVLKVFADNGINLTKIESRPTKEKPWEYLFYLDFEGSAQEGRGAKALKEIKGSTLFLKVLGTYPKG